MDIVKRRTIKIGDLKFRYLISGNGTLKTEDEDVVKWLEWYENPNTDCEDKFSFMRQYKVIERLSVKIKKEYNK